MKAIFHKTFVTFMGFLNFSSTQRSFICKIWTIKSVFFEDWNLHFSTRIANSRCWIIFQLIFWAWKKTFSNSQLILWVLWHSQLHKKPSFVEFEWLEVVFWKIWKFCEKPILAADVHFLTQILSLKMIFHKPYNIFLGF